MKALIKITIDEELIEEEHIDDEGFVRAVIVEDEGGLRVLQSVARENRTEENKPIDLGKASWCINVRPEISCTEGVVAMLKSAEITSLQVAMIMSVLGDGYFTREFPKGFIRIEKRRAS